MKQPANVSPMTANEALPALQSIDLAIAVIRGQRVILDRDLAALYDVEIKRFNEAVKRNAARFPADFMFQLDADEAESLRSQFATLKPGRGQHRKYLPYAFTEHGAIMAAMVLGSPRAVEVSVVVVRAFVRLRQASMANEDVSKRLARLEEQAERLEMNHDSFSRNTRAQLKQVFEALRELMTPPESPKRPIGFVHPKEQKNGKASKAIQAKSVGVKPGKKYICKQFKPEVVAICDHLTAQPRFSR